MKFTEDSVMYIGKYILAKKKTLQIGFSMGLPQQLGVVKRNYGVETLIFR